jgi:hypothetical protein
MMFPFVQFILAFGFSEEGLGLTALIAYGYSLSLKADKEGKDSHSLHTCVYHG